MNVASRSNVIIPIHPATSFNGFLARGSAESKLVAARLEKEKCLIVDRGEIVRAASLPGKGRATRFWYVDAKGVTPAPATSETVPKPAEAASPPTRKRELWQLLLDEKATKARLEAERESTKPDAEIIESLRGELKKVKAEIRSLKPAKPETKAAV